MDTQLLFGSAFVVPGSRRPDSRGGIDGVDGRRSMLGGVQSTTRSMR
jgi:hypothetical protein